MRTFLSITALIFMAACSTKPVPLVAGKDECASCAMSITDLKYGAELITEKGKVYKFDDMLCLMNYITGELKATEKIKTLLISDYNTQQLIEVENAIYLNSETLHTPMNGQVAAFANQTEAEKVNLEFPGKLIKWNEVQQLFK